MVIIDWLFYGAARPGWITTFGIVVGLWASSCSWIPVGLLAATQIDYPAAAAILLGALSWALGALRSRSGNLPSNPFMAASIQMIGGGAILVVAGVLSGELARFDVSTISTGSYLSWAYLFAIGSFIPFNAYIWLMRNTTPAKVSTYAFVNPVVAVLLGWLILSEPVTLNVIVAIGLLLGGVVLITQRSRRRKRLRPASPPLVCYDLDENKKLVARKPRRTEDRVLNRQEDLPLRPDHATTA